MKHIFILTVLRTEGESIKQSHTPGLYSTESEAQNDLRVNGDYLASRHYYKWAVIEKYPITFLPIPEEVCWFYWDGEKWFKTAKPPILEMVIGFAGIG